MGGESTPVTGSTFSAICRQSSYTSFSPALGKWMRRPPREGSVNRESLYDEYEPDIGRPSGPGPRYSIVPWQRPGLSGAVCG